jgi:glutathione synthase
MRIAIAITRAASVDETWTTVHLARAALSAGHSVRFVEPWDYEVDARGQLVARAHAFDPPVIEAHELVAQLRNRRARRCYVDVAGVDLMLVRASPLDPTLLAFLQLAEERGVVVINEPRGMLAVAHKAWLQSRRDVPVPAGIVTRSHGTAIVFFRRTGTGGVVVKPARGSGGRAVSLVADGDLPGFDNAFRAATRVGDGYVVVQEYLAAADEGEKRIVWLDGESIGGYLRRRAPGEFRHNLKRGGVAEPTDVTAAERVAIAALTPHLLRAGIRLAGLDLIGEYVIEVNALNPGGTFHADRVSGSHLADTIIARLTAGAPEARP